MDGLIVWQNALIHLLPPPQLDSQIFLMAWMRVVGRLNVTAGKRCCMSNQ